MSRSCEWRTQKESGWKKPEPNNVNASADAVKAQGGALQVWEKATTTEDRTQKGCPTGLFEKVILLQGMEKNTWNYEKISKLDQ